MVGNTGAMMPMNPRAHDSHAMMSKVILRGRITGLLQGDLGEWAHRDDAQRMSESSVFAMANDYNGPFSKVLLGSVVRQGAMVARLFAFISRFVSHRVLGGSSDPT